MSFIVWLIFVAAALLEVGGDAVVRRGLRTHSGLWVLLGCALLGVYGLTVNLVRWDFSKLLGVYVAFFAFVSVVFGRFAFREEVPLTTWFGLALVVLGGMIIQFGR